MASYEIPTGVNSLMYFRSTSDYADSGMYFNTTNDQSILWFTFMLYNQNSNSITGAKLKVFANGNSHPYEPTSGHGDVVLIDNEIQFQASPYGFSTVVFKDPPPILYLDFSATTFPSSDNGSQFVANVKWK